MRAACLVLLVACGEAIPGGGANDPGLVVCIGSALRARVTFQKPDGSATVVAPLVFHPPPN